MTIDAAFWVAISFFIFLGILIYFKIPQKVKNVLDENMSKTGFKSFFNRDIKTSMEAFESEYLKWELKMVDEGFVENY